MARIDRDLRVILRKVRAAGWRVEEGARHWRVYPTDRTVPPLTLSASREPRHYKNVVADLRRAGLDL